MAASAMAVSLIGVVIFMGSVDFADNLNLGRPRCQKVSNKKHSSSGSAGVPSIALATEGVSPARCLATDGSTRRRDVSRRVALTRQASAPRRWKMVTVETDLNLSPACERLVRAPTLPCERGKFLRGRTGGARPR